MVQHAFKTLTAERTAETKDCCSESAASHNRLQNGTDSDHSSTPSSARELSSRIGAGAPAALEASTPDPADTPAADLSAAALGAAALSDKGLEPIDTTNLAAVPLPGDEMFGERPAKCSPPALSPCASLADSHPSEI